MTYSLEDKDPEYQYTLHRKKDQDFSEPLKYNFCVSKWCQSE